MPQRLTSITPASGRWGHGMSDDSHPAIAQAIEHGADQALDELGRTRQSPVGLAQIRAAATGLADTDAVQAIEGYDDLGESFGGDADLATEDDAIIVQARVDQLVANSRSGARASEARSAPDEQTIQLTAAR
jgi:hypothetical protein